MGTRFLRLLPVLLVLLALPGGAARAQDSLGVRLDSVITPRDTVPVLQDSLAPRAPISPMGALLRSFVLPGWGQARLNRKLTGGIFIAFEGVSLAMTLKTTHELNYLRRTNSGRVGPKKAEQQDWLILLAFNHLMSGLEAYVSAHLWDFPGDLEIRRVPGGVGATMTLPLPR
ncbi:MAG: hypothetical protein AB7I33_03945 [Gemmatimonadales bacterium]